MSNAKQPQTWVSVVKEFGQLSLGAIAMLILGGSLYFQAAREEKREILREKGIQEALREQTLEIRRGADAMERILAVREKEMDVIKDAIRARD